MNVCTSRFIVFQLFFPLCVLHVFFVLHIPMFFACSPCYADLRVLDICLHMYLSSEAKFGAYKSMNICIYVCTYT